MEIWQTEDFTFEIKEYDIVEGGKEFLNTVTGLSESGKLKIKLNKDLVLPSKDNQGRDVFVVGMKSFKGEYHKNILRSVTIPEGYRMVDNAAFAFNGLEEVSLPNSLEAIGAAAFFRNKIRSIIIPKEVIELPMAALRGNRLEEIEIQGELTTLGDFALAENRLERVLVSDKLVNIGKQAFTANKNKQVILETVSGDNIRGLEDTEDYLVDPIEDNIEKEDLNYDVWEHSDFKFRGTEVSGFSKQGVLKNKENKNLVVPSTNTRGELITSIGNGAFRNLNKGYDIETIELPETITRIGHWAFEFNDIEEFKMPRDLEELGMGVFMMANLRGLVLNEKIRKIDQACFFYSELGEVKLPKTLEKITEASFRQCGITKLEFEEGSIVEEICALGFADNEITELILPESVKKLNGHQIFANNNIKELVVSADIEDLGFQTFLGSKENVVITTADGRNINNLIADQGNTYTVDPEIKASKEDKEDLGIALKSIENMDESRYIERFSKYLSSLVELSKELLENEASKSDVLGKKREIEFLRDRENLSALMHRKEGLKSTDYKKESWTKLEKVYSEVNDKVMVYNLKKEQLEKLYKDLEKAMYEIEKNRIKKEAV